MSEELLIAAAAATLERQEGGTPVHDSNICRNCGAALAGPFCHACGQKHAHLHKPFWELTEDFLHSVLHFDGRMWQTLRALFLKPGQLTLDWIDGRQMRHVPPIRLFIFTSLLLVLALAVSDVVLVRLDGHLGFIANPDKKAGGFSLGICTGDKKSKDCVKGRQKTGMDVDGDISTDVFRLAPKEKAKVAALDSSMVKNIDSVEGQKVAGAAFDFINKAAADPKLLNKAVSGSISSFVLLATPIMALLLKLFYIRRKKYLAEHAFFALHVHTFFFASLLLSVLLVWVSRGTLGGWAMAGTLWAVYSIYFLLALKRAYGQGWIKTVLKSMLVTGFYLFTLFTIGTFMLSRYMIHLAGKEPNTFHIGYESGNDDSSSIADIVE